jgi:MFS transporter, ACS family, tartrate transporter
VRHSLAVCAPRARYGIVNRDAVNQETDVTDLEKAVLRKIAWRFLPLLIVAYVVNYLDRTSLSIAALTMNADLGISATQFGYAAGLFFVGYCLFEVPANLALYRFGARVWLARIMITWGLASALTAFVVGPVSFCAIRFLLGVAEAGFFPGVAYFLSCWFPPQYRARILAWFLLAIPASSLIGSPVAGLLLGLHGMGGLAGWKWMFILVSVPAVVLGVIALRVIVDRPDDAAWLSEAERSTLKRMLAEESRAEHHTRLVDAMRDVRVLVLAATQFGLIVGSYGIGVWLPQIVKRGSLSNLEVSFLTAAPYLVATFGPIAWAAISDRSDNKIGHVAGASLLAAAGLFISAHVSSLGLALTGITLALLGINAARAIFWAVPTRFLSGMAAAGGMAFINSVGTVGGFVGPAMVGLLKDATGSFSAGLGGMAVLLVVSALLAGSLRWVVARV